MPYPHEHAARLRDPAKYVRISRENDKFGPGIHALWGVTQDGKAEQHRSHLTKNIEDVDLALNAILGSADVSVSDILNLRAGQVLRLDRRTPQPLDVTVNGKPLFLATAGLHGRRKALQIIRKAGPQNTGDDT